MGTEKEIVLEAARTAGWSAQKFVPVDFWTRKAFNAWLMTRKRETIQVFFAKHDHVMEFACTTDRSREFLNDASLVKFLRAPHRT